MVAKRLKYAADLFSDLLLTALAGDLLHLYFAGAWCEPNPFLLVAELVSLFTIAIWGLMRFSAHLRIIVKPGDLR